jgi:choline dehydrogenase-like flavoprotein
MHADPRHGVVDADCRVHGIDNLYLASSSVFPTSGHSNPTFTILSLCFRLADKLKSRLFTPPVDLD